MSAVPDPRPFDETIQVLVVCTANIVRSPFGEAVLQHEASRRLDPSVQVWVQSAGVNGLVGEPAVEAMREEAAARGLSLERHRAQAVERQLVERMDLVLCMTERHRAKLAKVTPYASRYTFTLKEFVRLLEALKPLDPTLTPRERVRLLARVAHGARAYVARPGDKEDVTDPIGGPREGYAEIAREITALTMFAAEGLFGPVRRPPSAPVDPPESLFDDPR